MYEQLSGRTPLIGYSFFQALMEIAEGIFFFSFSSLLSHIYFYVLFVNVYLVVGEIHTGENLFGYVGRNGSTLKLAYDAYVPSPLLSLPLLLSSLLFTFLLATQIPQISRKRTRTS